MTDLPDNESLLDWAMLLREAHDVSERCLERLLDLRIRFPEWDAAWNDSTDGDHPAPRRQVEVTREVTEDHIVAQRDARPEGRTPERPLNSS
jgi:hypothetical protein